MKLYHGSPNNFNMIRKSQARAGEGVEVPEDELLDAIYLTPRYDFALAMASTLEGVTDVDEPTRSITFENPDLFDPEKEVYVYEVDSEKISKENLKEVDELQVAVLNMDEIELANKYTHRAGDVEQYYEIKNLKRETKRETKINREFKIR